MTSINHPTNRPNFTEVSTAGITVYFSYRTPVAFRAPGWGLVVRENEWGPTTGRHLNWIDNGAKSARVSASTFAQLLALAEDGEAPAETLTDEVTR